jgi:alkyldihydroxyacetonephosphate synthase
VQSLCLELGGSVAHHPGAGWFRTPWLREELGTGHALLQALKDAVDPRNVCNPGKLGLRAREVA